MLFVCMAFAFAYVRVFRMFRYEFSQCTLNALFYMYVVESASLFRFGIDSKRFIFFRAAAQLIFLCSHSFVFVSYTSWIISTPTQENYIHYLCITSRYHVRAYNIQCSDFLLTASWFRTFFVFRHIHTHERIKGCLKI